jgi:tetratricopeptide (TPR) repeat protein
MALYKIGKYQDVIKDCDKYIELNGENINMDVLFLRATAEYKLKQYEKVVDDMKIAIFVKESCGAYYYRGLANYKLGHFRQAVSDIKKAIELKADVLETYDDKLPKLLEFGVNIGVNIFGKSKDHNPKTERPIGLKGIKGSDM